MIGMEWTTENWRGTSVDVGEQCRELTSTAYAHMPPNVLIELEWYQFEWVLSLPVYTQLARPQCE